MLSADIGADGVMVTWACTWNAVASSSSETRVRMMKGIAIGSGAYSDAGSDRHSSTKPVGQYPAQRPDRVKTRGRYANCRVLAIYRERFAIEDQAVELGKHDLASAIGLEGSLEEA